MKSYKRKPGEFEIRILPDGRVFMSAPDESLLKIARALDKPVAKRTSVRKARENERAKANRNKQGNRTKPA